MEDNNMTTTTKRDHLRDLIIDLEAALAKFKKLWHSMDADGNVAPRAGAWIETDVKITLEEWKDGMTQLDGARLQSGFSLYIHYAPYALR